jgi:hypothetical protein
VPDLSPAQGSLSGEWEVPVTRNAKITLVNEGGGGWGRAPLRDHLLKDRMEGSPVTRNAEIDPGDNDPTPRVVRAFAEQWEVPVTRNAKRGGWGVGGPAPLRDHHSPPLP